TVGAGLDFTMVAAQPLLLLALVGGLMALKALVMFAAARAARLSPRDAAATAVALAQGGEFAFVLFGFALGAGVLGAELAKLLTAVVALSMACTPLAMAAFERWVLKHPGAGLAEPEDTPYDDGAPDAIIAGFGRFGQVTARLLIANDFRTVTLDASIEQIDTLRRFGMEVHYGDASRLDLLRTAGAEKARLLVVAIDDRDKALEMVEIARQAFPHLTVLARAWDRRHAYELLSKGAHEVERETFEGGLSMGRRALKRLGLSDYRATRAATLFRQHDRALFDQLAPIYGEEERFILAARASRETMDQLLRAEMSQMAEDERVAEDAGKPTV
ncbi:MAG: NAD-binding protein, partial [Phenylobacterium sp.]|uniref:NAD-binding protein n=1 Tax=Phenylobacterium sp. TaxID=1871053 RepID=UPI0027377458